jgi:2-aminoadipate transaminase
MSTFSKILAPGLRVAWIAADREIVRRIELAKETADLCTSTLGQKMILEYLRRGYAEPHLEKVRRFYDHKCAVMQRSLERHLGALGRWSRPLGGLFLWVELQAPVDTLPLLKGVVEQEKVAYIPGSPFFVDGGGSNALRLSFSNTSDENIELGVRRLSDVFAAAARALSK